MAKHLFRKFFGLVVLYIIIIFGIFAIQFRKEMSIFQNFHSLTLRLSADTSQEGTDTTVLSNNFRVSGNGIVILASESNPVLLQETSGGTVPLTLQGWQENDENSFTLLFSNNVSLSFHADKSSFDMRSQAPNNGTLIIPYETASAYNITDVLKNRIIVKSKDKAFSLFAGNVTTSTILLSSLSSTIAQVSPYEETKAFSYASIIGAENASETALSALVAQARNQVIRLFETSQNEASSEKFIVAYVAEMASQGLYSEALVNVPESFVNGNNRTYFSAPYFNTLVSMNQTLVRENENISFSMQYSLERSLLDVYTLDTFPTYLLQQRAEDIESILLLPTTLTNFEPTTQQAVGILDVYITLSKHLPTSAALLEPVLEKCTDTLQNATIVRDNFLNITNDEGIVDTSFAIKTGSVLQEYGDLTSREEFSAGGTMLLVSALQNVTTATRATLAYMYPHIVTSNPYYPHADVLGYNDGTPVWMWNIIPEKSYVVDEAGTITMNFDFPISEIYHSIIKGIEPFNSIEIYGLDYATDARFETYNAPGYVYLDETGTLLLRYRQRSEIEEMKLNYGVEQEEVLDETQADTETQAETTSEPL